MEPEPTIVVVEDDAHIADLVEMYLRRAGFGVHRAADGERGLEVVAQRTPRLVILDVGLPGALDGFEVCRRLRASGDVPIILVTARDDEIDRVLGLELGADDYVTKPFSPRELVARVKAILDLVARHHARPDLSADWIGGRLGISARQVHRLVEEGPKTLHEHILEARLQQALSLLSDPDGPALPVAEIARRCGFAATSHFCRSFKVRFGDTPTGVRAAAAREAVADISTAFH